MNATRNAAIKIKFLYGEHFTKSSWLSIYKYSDYHSIRLDWNALLRVDNIVEKKNQINKIHFSSSSSYQSIWLIKVNVTNNNDNNNNSNNK